MTKDIRRNIDATVKLNESLDEGPVGWAANKLVKTGQRVASKFTGGAMSQKLKQNVNVRSGAEQMIKIWNVGYGGRGIKRTPMNILKFLAKDKDMKMSRDQLKAAWNKTPQLTKNFGTFDQVANQLKAQRPTPTGLTASPKDKLGGPRESVEEAKLPATQQMSVDNLRNLFINAIHVKNTSDAEKELGDFPGDDEEKKSAAQVNPNAPDEQQPMPPGDAEKLKVAGAIDTDGDKDYDYDDVASIAVKQGKGEEALQAFIKKMAAKTGNSDKAALAYGMIMGKSPNVKG